MAFSLHSLLKHLRFSGQHGIVGIDFGSSSIKAVQVHARKGVAELDTYGELALGPYGGKHVGSSVKLPTSALVDALRDITREAKITTKECALAVPLSATLTSFIEMPAVRERDLATMIPIEARKYIPVPINEVSLDWTIIPDYVHSPDGADTAAEGEKRIARKSVHVLLVAVHNEVLRQYKNVVEEVGFSVALTEVEIFSTMRATIKDEHGPTLIIDIGARTTKLYMIENGMIHGSHTVNRGSQDITTVLAHATGMSAAQAEELKRGGGFQTAQVRERPIAGSIPPHLDYIFSEASRVVLQHHKRYNKTVMSFIFSGGGALLPGLLAFAEGRFDGTVILANPFSALATPAFLHEMLRANGPAFTVAVGAALGGLQARV